MGVNKMKKEDISWMEDHIEIINVKNEIAEVMIPSIAKLKIHKNSKGKYVLIEGRKIYSRYL